MSKKLMARIVSGAAVLSLLFAIHEAPTVSAENKITNEQVCSQPNVISLSAGVTTLIKHTIYKEPVDPLIGYTTTTVNVRDMPNTEDGNIIDTYIINTKVEYYPEGVDGKWGAIYNPTDEYDYGYICLKYLSKEKTKIEEYHYNGQILNCTNGTVNGPSGRETYYNLPMHKVITYMKDLGYDYGYWVRSDGVKMLGQYIMVAADLNVYSKGDKVDTSLGKGIVCDTGDLTNNGVALDIAVTWN